MLAVYLLLALAVTARDTDTRPCAGMTVEVTDPDGSAQRFVTAAELSRELDSLPDKARSLPLSAIDTQALRRRLLALDKLEDASVVRYTDGSIRINAVPIIPVARVMDRGESYYINREGKRVEANARYHKDVPLIEGHFDPLDTVFTPESLLPLLAHIQKDSLWNNFISMVKVKSPRDIILVPVVREHVINLGAADNLDSKFDRLRRFYREVLPTLGWQKYDTLSLKWNGQLVATRRVRAASPLRAADYEVNEIDDTATMLVGDNVAPGQTRPGVKANSEKPIPQKTKKQS